MWPPIARIFWFTICMLALPILCQGIIPEPISTAVNGVVGDCEDLVNSFCAFQGNKNLVAAMDVHTKFSKLTDNVKITTKLIDELSTVSMSPTVKAQTAQALFDAVTRIVTATQIKASAFKGFPTVEEQIERDHNLLQDLIGLPTELLGGIFSGFGLLANSGLDNIVCTPDSK